MTTNAAHTQEYLDIIDELNGDVPSRRASHAYMKSSTAIVHHRVVDCSFVPRLFNQRTYDTMKYTAETAHAILCKVIDHYLKNPSYREIFDFDARLVELILLPRGYDTLLPFARVDTFLDEDTYEMRFCEFNGDGSSGMNENREITNSLQDAAAFRAFAKRHDVRGCNLFEPWVDEFIDIYGTYKRKVANPRFAICDYLENGVVDEFHLFADLFRQRGYECAVVDVRDLTFDGKVLRDSEGKPVNAIWRRCVTNDVIDHWGDSQDLINAVRAQKVALIGSFAGHIVHDKQIFEALFNPLTRQILTDEENDFVRRTVPQTAFLIDGEVDIDDVRENKDRWIIKPSDHYGADNVYAGCEVNQERWGALIDAFTDERAGYPFIAQHYITPFKTKTLPPDTRIDELADDEVSSTPVLYNNLNGLYLYNGTFQGVFSRLGPLPTISKENQGMTAATIWVDVDEGAYTPPASREASTDGAPDETDGAGATAGAGAAAGAPNTPAPSAAHEPQFQAEGTAHAGSAGAGTEATGAAATPGAASAPGERAASARPTRAASKRQQTFMSAITAVFLAVTFIACGLAVCAGLPYTTETICGATCNDADSPFSRDELITLAAATRDYSIESNDRAKLMEAIAAANASAGTPYANATASELASAPDAYTLTPDALSHLDDVFDVVSRTFMAMIGVAVLSAFCLMVLLRTFGMRAVARALTWAGAGVIALFVALGAWAALDFNGLFAAFHSLFFAAGTWTFPSDSLLICMFPLAFWMGMGAVWLATTALLSILSVVLGVAMSKRALR